LAHPVVGSIARFARPVCHFLTEKSKIKVNKMVKDDSSCKVSK